MGKRCSKLTGFHANHARERLFGVFKTAVPIVQDSDAVPELGLLSNGVPEMSAEKKGLQGRILEKNAHAGLACSTAPVDTSYTPSSSRRS